MFNGRPLIIATQHNKESVIAPLFEKSLGVKCTTLPLLNTDLLGTFTGEVDRKDNATTTAINKCLLAMQLSNCDLCVASEGSFGPHPSIAFINCNEELLVFIDKVNNLQIIAKEISTETNFNGSDIKSEKELKEFAIQAQFPSHGLIIKPTKNSFTNMVKGITNWDELLESYHNIKKIHGSVYLETDMRACYNPTRMKVIEKAAKNLVLKINTKCPQCNIPGFAITKAIRGLPCQACLFPTNSILSYIYTCSKCSYFEEKKYPNHKHFEEPMFCDVCNP